MLFILISSTGALLAIFFSSLSVIAFFATNDLLDFISFISTKGNSEERFNSSTILVEIKIL